MDKQISVNMERTMEHRAAKKEKKLRRASLLTNSMYVKAKSSEL